MNEARKLLCSEFSNAQNPRKAMAPVRRAFTKHSSVFFNQLSHPMIFIQNIHLLEEIEFKYITLLKWNSKFFVHFYPRKFEILLVTPAIEVAVRKFNEGMDFSNWYETKPQGGFIKNKHTNNVWYARLKWVLKVSGSFWLIILIKHLCLSGVWLAENLRLNIQKTCVLKRLDYVFKTY